MCAAGSWLSCLCCRACSAALLGHSYDCRCWLQETSISGRESSRGLLLLLYQAALIESGFELPEPSVFVDLLHSSLAAGLALSNGHAALTNHQVCADAMFSTSCHVPYRMQHAELLACRAAGPI